MKENCSIRGHYPPHVKQPVVNGHLSCRDTFSHIYIYIYIYIYRVFQGGIRGRVVRNPSRMENHTKCIFSHTLHFNQAKYTAKLQIMKTINPSPFYDIFTSKQKLSFVVGALIGVLACIEEGISNDYKLFMGGPIVKCIYLKPVREDEILKVLSKF